MPQTEGVQIPYTYYGTYEDFGLGSDYPDGRFDDDEVEEEEDDDK